MNKKDTFEVYELILRLAVLYSSRCNVCHKKCITGKYFTMHHINYRCLACMKKLSEKQKVCDKCGGPIEKRHSDFANRLDYYKYLFPKVPHRIKDFALVCNSDHGSVGKLARHKKPNRKRLMKLANQTAND